MLSKIKDFVSPGTLRNVTTLMSGSVFSVALPILTAPISSRIFSAADYGILGVYMAISGLISVLAYAHYQHGILIEKEYINARQMLWLTITFCSAVALLSGVVILILSLVKPEFTQGAIGFWVFFIPVSIICSGVSSCVLLWANKVQKYKVLTFNRVVQAILTVLIQIGIGLLIDDETGLLVGFISGQIIGVALLLNKFLRTSDYTNIGRPKFSRFRALAIQHRGLLMYSTPSEFINTLINQIPIFFLQRFAGISFVGNYNFAQRLLGVPQILLSSSISEIFRQKAAEQFNRDGTCSVLFVKTFKSLLFVSIIPFIILFLFSEDIFAFLFGEQWREAGEIARILCVLFLCRFIISPLTYMYVVAKRYREDFIMHVILLLIVAGSFWVGGAYFSNGHYQITIYSISYSLFYIIYLLRSYSMSKSAL